VNIEVFVLEALFWLSIYFLVSLLWYFGMAFISRSQVKRSLGAGASEPNGVLPAVTFLIPACNESAIILRSVRALLGLNYPLLKIIVINDGSSDQTFSILKNEFLLSKIDVNPRVQLTPTYPRDLYQSGTEPRLQVLNKPNSGKSDSLNVGLQFVDTEFFVISDADTVWEGDALRWLVGPVVGADGDKIIAVGGVVGLMNSEGNLMSRLQLVEYVRAFYVGRLCWNDFNAVPLISGAAGLYRTEVALQAGGIPLGSETEDLEMTFRLHEYCGRYRPGYRIYFVPQIVCRTWVPLKWSVLIRQRLRWQRGLVQTIFKFFRFSFSFKNFYFSLFVIPYTVLFEILSAPFEWLAVVLILIGRHLHLLTTLDVVLIAVLSLLLGWTGSLLGSWVAWVNPATRKEYHWTTIAGYSIVELCGYRQILSLVRLFAALTAFKRRQISWRSDLPADSTNQTNR